MQKRMRHRVYWSKPWDSYRIEVIWGRVTSWPGIIPDTGEWFIWLEQVPSFHFQAKDSGHFTARKETRKRGGVYWIAYRHIDGLLVKKYIGPQAQITIARLEEIVGELERKARPEA
ncbi:MAG: hypothetical protein ACJ8DI_13865 [Ktedonobacteraceae bacterium]